MLVFRYLVVVSAGAILAFGDGLPAISQESPMSESPVTDESSDSAGSDSLSEESFAAPTVTEKPHKTPTAKVGTGTNPPGVQEGAVLEKKRTSRTAIANEVEWDEETVVFEAIAASSPHLTEDSHLDKIALDAVALAESESPPPETLDPDSSAFSALDLLWEADIPAGAAEISEDMAQNTPTPETLLGQGLESPYREAIDSDPEENRDPKENESEEIAQEVDPPREASPRGRQIVPPPENLAPSANPLLFPTEPDEVTIDLSQPITLEEAIALARQNNQDWRVAWLNLEKADAALREALAANFPSLTAEINLSRTDSATTELSNRRLINRGLSASTNDTITDLLDGTLQLSYTLYDGGARPAQIRQAEETVRFNQLEVERVGEELRFNTANAYYNLQQADANVGIEQAAVDAAKQTLRDAELLERAGLGTRFDVLRAQVDLANSQQNLVNARADRVISKRQLVQVLSLGEQVEVTIADRIQRSGDWELSLEETIIIAYRNRAELEQQLVQREIDEQQRQLALSVLRPQVNLFANYSAANILNFGEGFADGYAIGATLSWTLFDGGAAKANSRQEELDIEIAEATFEQQRKSIRVEVEEAYENLKSSDENIKTAIVAVQLAEESLRLARLRFQAGVGTQTEVIDAQTELTRSRGNLLTATVGYNRALAALQRAVSNVPDNRLFDLP
ncbi:MAG: TolC family protein [Spirulina sp.]